MITRDSSARILCHISVKTTPPADISTSLSQLAFGHGVEVSVDSREVEPAAQLYSSDGGVFFGEYEIKCA